MTTTITQDRKDGKNSVAIESMMELMESLCEKYGQSDDDVTRIEMRPGVIRFETSSGWTEHSWKEVN
ncbi:hypothetical protein OHB41_33155 [Streptomyces sp. NBC_01571]|uniref:hypothetical protein n=1 Tax=Streptomyces sp. NBC_01571 TaxID=2975883 RepID=UPI0022581A60|nr:hypothetical protein [Streptomyces sp. NBC_01571]MCX4577950.1 hypothetical protein [Streptomyces sp. NBC_01571]